MGGVEVDTVKYRKYLWDKEYSTRKSLPSSNTFHPSSSLRKFLHKYSFPQNSSALDIGSGNGRNSIFLALSGFKYVKGLELSSVGVKIAKKEIKNLGLDEVIEIIQGDVGNIIEKEKTKFDLIIDMTTLHSLLKDSREKAVIGIKNLLKPGGYYLIFTLMADSPAVVDLKAKNPGPETDSYRFDFEGDTITEKAFTKKELVEMFSPLKLIEYEEYQTVTRAYKGEYPRIYVTALFQKKH